MNKVKITRPPWEDSLEALREYISSHDRIKIDEHCIEITDESRKEFYNLFNKVRLDFIVSTMGGFLDKAKDLAVHYKNTRDYIIRTYNLKDIVLNKETARFLESPEDELLRPLFKSLFQVLAGAKDTEIFAEESIRGARRAFINLYEDLYEAWLLVSIIKAMKAKRIFSIDTMKIDETRFSSVRMGRVTMGNVAPVADPKIATRIDFSKPKLCQFVVPNFIAEIGSVYLAVRAGLSRRVIMNARDHNQSREWLKNTPATASYGQHSTLLYMGNLNEINLVADDYSICKPDFIITNGFNVKGETNLDHYQIKNLYQNLKPRFDIFINYISHLIDSAITSPQVEWESIKYINIDFNESNLRNLIYSMVQGWLTNTKREVNK